MIAIYPPKLLSKMCEINQEHIAHCLMPPSLSLSLSAFVAFVVIFSRRLSERDPMAALD